VLANLPVRGHPPVRLVYVRTRALRRRRAHAQHLRAALLRQRAGDRKTAHSAAAAVPDRQALVL